MNIIIWIVFGGIIGWIATLIMKKDASYGVLANILFGIIGSALGGYLFSLIGLTGGIVVSTISAIIGAMLVIWIVSVLKKA